MYSFILIELVASLIGLKSNPLTAGFICQEMYLTLDTKDGRAFRVCEFKRAIGGGGVLC